MSIFGDKVFDGMDDLSQLIVPYRSSLQDLWAELPEQVIVDSKASPSAMLQMVNPSRCWNRHINAHELFDQFTDNAYTKIARSAILANSYDARSELARRIVLEVDPDSTWTPERGFIGRIVVRRNEVLSEGDLIRLTASAIMRGRGNYRRYRTIGRKICKVLDIPVDPNNEPGRYKNHVREYFTDKLQKGELLLRDLDKFLQFTTIIENCFERNEICDKSMRKILLYKVICEAGQPFYDINGWNLGE